MLDIQALVMVELSGQYNKFIIIVIYKEDYAQAAIK
jgi:hypothetical protein